MQLPLEKNRQIKALAEKDGCKPFWFDGIFGYKYHCGCEDGRHYSYQQCSVISIK